MILNQYLANIKPLNIPQILFQNDNNSDIKSPKSSQLETIEEGENEEEQMEDSPEENDDGDEIIVQMTTPTETEKIGEQMATRSGNYWKFPTTSTGELHGEKQQHAQKQSEFSLRKQIRSILNKIT